MTLFIMMNKPPPEPSKPVKLSARKLKFMQSYYISPFWVKSDMKRAK